MKKNVRIYIWLHNGKVMKAIACPDEKTITVYDENDTILIKRTGLTAAQLKKIEQVLSTFGAKRIDGESESFTYL